MTRRTHDGRNADESHAMNRRTVLLSTGAVAAASVLPVASGAPTRSIDAELDTTTDALQEALVVFDANDDVDRLATLDLADGYYGFEVLPIGYTRLTGSQIETVAGWPEVRRVEANRELEYYNDDAREVTGAGEVQTGMGYTGDGVHVAVIDTGVDGDHPDLTGSLEHNFRFVDPLDRETMWIDAGPADTDDNGHGTHTSGSVAGDGTKSDGEFRGMAPDASLTVYSTGVTLVLLNTVGAYDHLLDRVRAGETDVQVVSNSWGSTNDNDYDPDGAVQEATWNAYQEGILSVFAAGNDGPDANTLSDYAPGPHVLSVAATKDDKSVTDFSSRGRKPGYPGETNYDRETALDNLRAYYEQGETQRPLAIYRPGVAAPGHYVMSTLAPEDPLQGYAAGTGYEDTELWYGRISGTSMSCPVTAGVCAQLIEAYREAHGADPDPIEVINLVEAAADDCLPEHSAWNVGAGFLDAVEAATTAESGSVPSFDDVELAVDGQAPDA